MQARMNNPAMVLPEMHARDLRKAGETDERLFAVAAWREAPYFTEAATQLRDRADPVPDEVEGGRPAL